MMGGKGQSYFLHADPTLQYYRKNPHNGQCAKIDTSGDKYKAILKDVRSPNFLPESL